MYKASISNWIPSHVKRTFGQIFSILRLVFALTRKRLNMFPLRSLAAFVITLLMLVGCANPGKPPEAALIYMPPDQYLHSFPGTILVSDIPADTRAGTPPPVLAIAQVTSNNALNLHMCRIQLPAEGTIDRKFRKCLFLVGLASCNGAVNVQPDAQGRRVIPPGYERTCSDYWSEIYDRLKPNPQTGRD